jgi:hypothetical protein
METIASRRLHGAPQSYLRYPQSDQRNKSTLNRLRSLRLRGVSETCPPESPRKSTYRAPSRLLPLLQVSRLGQAYPHVQVCQVAGRQTMMPRHLSCHLVGHLEYNHKRMESPKMRALLYRFGGHYHLHHLLRKLVIPGSLVLEIRAQAFQSGQVAHRLVPHRQSHMVLARICPRSWLQSHASMARLPLRAFQFPRRIQSA